ncbi:hypothetical protein PROFUN_01977 [Planoprotostelium fungivorum]|uniref:Uncharacterized protein n=1 Tax=Planoprotostelium fungivorum TaxID=1890364 RepID=A0A2P6NB30_9EUKA|nr:hypothetical protein PROFUN_01977 [Planoprotostelium fungivorum]
MSKTDSDAAATDQMCLFQCSIIGTDVFVSIISYVIPLSTKSFVKQKGKPSQTELKQLVTWSRLQRVSREWYHTIRPIIPLSVFHNWIVRQSLERSSSQAVEYIVQKWEKDISAIGDDNVLSICIERGFTNALEYLLRREDRKIIPLSKSVEKMCRSPGHHDVLTVLARDQRIDLTPAYFGLSEYRNQMQEKRLMVMAQELGDVEYARNLAKTLHV